MKTREQKGNYKLTEIERFDWFIERIQTRVVSRSYENTSNKLTMVILFPVLLVSPLSRYLSDQEHSSLNPVLTHRQISRLFSRVVRQTHHHFRC